jgi:hypothetical protein
LVRIRAIALAGAVCLLAHGADAIAQTTSETDEDPTRPILISVRPEFYRVGANQWRFQTIGRYDTAMLRDRRWLGGRRGILLRFELPVSTAEHPATAVHGGVGDAYAQMLVVPWLSRKFTCVLGSGLSVPTGSYELLGTGKWVLAPAVIPLWFVGHGMFYVKTQNFTSIAGDPARPDVNFLLITPTVIQRVGRASWILADTETKTDWRRDRRTGVKSGLQFGHVIAAGVGLWIKPEVWWGPNQDGRWNLKTGVVWYR